MTENVGVKTESKENIENEGWGETVRTIFWALLIAAILRTVLFQPFTIPSESMRPQLLVGDYLVASKYAYGYSRFSLPFSPNIFRGRILAIQPKRGDIVVFKWPRDTKIDYIKRLIGLPGDTVQVKNGRVFLNGRPLAKKLVGDEAIVEHRGGSRVVTRYRETMPNGHSYITYNMIDGGRFDNTPVYRVPPGYYFMMGDNRDNSLDSRDWGFVPAQNLVGRGERILISVNDKFSLVRPWTWYHFRPRVLVSLRKSK
ncbi:MAG: signal peptidase I [Robiginitomaculum sp.]|nr:MAG: signal peptidase I [Robiginitomaculum sp.]